MIDFYDTQGLRNFVYLCPSNSVYHVHIIEKCQQNTPLFSFILIVSIYKIIINIDVTS